MTHASHRSLSPGYLFCLASHYSIPIRTMHPVPRSFSRQARAPSEISKFQNFETSKLQNSITITITERGIACRDNAFVGLNLAVVFIHHDGADMRELRSRPQRRTRPQRKIYNITERGKNEHHHEAGTSTSLPAVESGPTKDHCLHHVSHDVGRDLFCIPPLASVLARLRRPETTYNRTSKV